MKPESNSLRYFGITRSKGKMYELGLPEESHIAVPDEIEPAALFPLSIGTLVDAAAALNDAASFQDGLVDGLRSDIGVDARRRLTSALAILMTSGGSLTFGATVDPVLSVPGQSTPSTTR